MDLDSLVNIMKVCGRENVPTLEEVLEVDI